MQLLNTTGQNIANPPQILVTKSISSLIINTSLTYAELSNEEISVEIERANGSNFEITRGFMSLKDFILLTTYSDDALTSETPYKLTAVCEICENGAIFMQEKDVLRIQFRNLKAAASYVVDGLEEPITSSNVLSFEKKSMASEDTIKSFNTDGSNLVVINKDNRIEEIAYRYDNGQIVKYSIRELSALSRSIDPIAYVDDAGKAHCTFSDKLVLPLVSVESIEIRKQQGGLINLVFRHEVQ